MCLHQADILKLSLLLLPQDEKIFSLRSSLIGKNNSDKLKLWSSLSHGVKKCPNIKDFNLKHKDSFSLGLRVEIKGLLF